MTRVVGATIVALLGASSGALAQSGEWRAYSADLAGSKKILRPAVAHIFYSRLGAHNFPAGGEAASGRAGA